VSVTATKQTAGGATGYVYRFTPAALLYVSPPRWYDQNVPEGIVPMVGDRFEGEHALPLGEHMVVVRVKRHVALVGLSGELDR